MPTFDFGEGTGGAATGASVGAAVGGPFGAGVGAAAGFVLGGLAGGKAKDDAKKEQRRREQQILQLSSPQQILQNARKFQNQFGAIAGLGGQALQSTVATNIARRGLTGTGLGTALTGAALSAPGIFATRDSLGRAQQTANLQVAALGGTPVFNPSQVGSGQFGIGSPGFGEFATTLAGLGLKNRNESNSGSLFPFQRTDSQGRPLNL